MSKVKKLVELLTLSTNLYMISKDEEFLKNLEEMIRKGKKKVSHLVDEFTSESDEDDEEKFIEKLLHKAKQAKEDFENKIEEVAILTYTKMKIANTEELQSLTAEIKKIKNELALAEARIVHLEEALKFPSSK